MFICGVLLLFICGVLLLLMLSLLVLHLVYYSRVYMWSIVGCVSVAYSIVFLCL